MARPDPVDLPVNSPRYAARIATMIHLIGDDYVIFANDLSEIYGIALVDLESGVELHQECFPPDFALRLPVPGASVKDLCGASRGGIGVPGTSLAFTTAGIGMLGCVFPCKHVAQANVAVLRAIARRRRLEGVPAPRAADSLH